MTRKKVLLGAAIAAAPLLALVAGCIIEVGDASIHLTWTINGQAATGDACTAANAARVRIVEDDNNDGFEDWRSIDFQCADGSEETIEHFHSGKVTYIAFELRSAAGTVLSRVPSSGYEAFTPAVGSNARSAAFTTSATQKAFLKFAWYLHYVGGPTWAPQVCTQFGATKVQFWLETNGDDTADDTVDYVCSAGQGSTGEIFTAGQAIKYAFALYDAGGTLLSKSTNWDTKTLAAGENDHGRVNFILGDYGPLDVDLTWADKISDPAYGPCDGDPYTTDKVGYLLKASNGDTYGDPVNIATDPTTCEVTYTWDIVDFDTYLLIVDGANTAGTVEWHGECPNLLVDNWALDSNAFTCQIAMTKSP